MSSSSITDPHFLREFVDRYSLSQVLVQPVKRISFWGAVTLPLLHLPLLASGLESQPVLLAFLVLVTLNVCALLMGHSYGRN